MFVVNGYDSMALTALVLNAASTLLDGVHAGVMARGFDDLRPAHGFAFARIAPDGATTKDIADHLGVTKQAGSQLVDELIQKGYVARRPHPTDARARLIVLTERGWACTRAAEQAAADTMAGWVAVLGERRLAELRDDLARVTPMGRLRPTW
jgi:DNA-binding MarR family transcriptional regulator